MLLGTVELYFGANIRFYNKYIKPFIPIIYFNIKASYFDQIFHPISLELGIFIASVYIALKM